MGANFGFGTPVQLFMPNPEGAAIAPKLCRN
jgi:hypothetical protein